MPNPSQAFTFENAAFNPGELRVAEFSGKESLSRLFRFDMALGSVQADVQFEDLINKPGTLTLTEGGAPHRVHGLVIDFEQHGFRAEEALYRAVLVPRAWVLTLTFQSRIFQQMSIPQVIEEVLQGGGLPGSAFRLDLQGSYEPREYVTQFEETDWNFICRWMEHLGLFFYFEHGDDGDVLVISDDSTGCPEADIDDELAYHPGSGSLSETQGQPTIDEISIRERVGTGQVVLNEYNPRTPHNDLRMEAETGQELPGMRYEYGAHYVDAGQGDTLARIRAEELTAQRRVLSGGSNVTAFRPGHVFELNLGGDFRSDLNHSWLLTGVEHYGSQRSGLGSVTGMEGASYRNTFTCIPASVTYRPPRLTPVPHVPGVVAAVTETTGGDYAHINEDGDYRGRFKWDLGDAPAGEASKWMRMRQAYSGPGYGIHFPNHAGTEMVVAFENGHPDRPLVLGTVENDTQQSPVTSENKSQNIIRTHAGNQILLEDKSGATKIVLTTPGGHSTSLDDGGPAITASTSGGHVLKLDDDGKKAFLYTTNGHMLEMHDEEKFIQLLSTQGNGLTLNDESKYAELLTTDGHALLMDDTGKQIRLISTDSHEVRLSDQENKIEVKTKSGTSTVVLDEAAGHITVDAKNEITVVTGDSRLNMKKDGTIRLSGKNLSIIASDALTLSGMNVAITGQQEAKVGVGTQSVTFNNQKVETSGAGITAAAVGVHEITGAMVKIN